MGNRWNMLSYFCSSGSEKNGEKNRQKTYKNHPSIRDFFPELVHFDNLHTSIGEVCRAEFRAHLLPITNTYVQP